MIYQDKILHASVSMNIVFVLSAIINIPLSVFVAFLVGLAKEIYDGATGGKFDWYDIFADTIGIIIATLILII